MGVEVLCSCLVASSAIGLAVLERVRPYDAGQRLFREGFWTDLVLYALLQSYLLGLLIAALVRSGDELVGWSRLQVVGGWPVAAQVALFVVSHDFYIYWFHRWQHASPLLFRLHEAHHSSSQVDWLAGARSHAFEILVNQSVEFAPMVLLGATPEAIVIKGTVSAIWGMWIHANVRVHTGRLQWIVNGPEAHRWHHATDSDAHGTNLGTKLALWDRLFGTAFIPSGRSPSGYGLPEVPFPTGYVAQHLFAFRRH